MEGGGKEGEERTGGEKPLYHIVHTIFSISKKTNSPDKTFFFKQKSKCTKIYLKKIRDH